MSRSAFELIQEMEKKSRENSQQIVDMAAANSEAMAQQRMILLANNQRKQQQKLEAQLRQAGINPSQMLSPLQNQQGYGPIQLPSPPQPQFPVVQLPQFATSSMSQFSQGTPNNQAAQPSRPQPSQSAPLSVGNAASFLPSSRPSNCTSSGPTILPKDLLEQIPARSHSAHAALGMEAVMETKKGLSRVLNISGTADVELFLRQLEQCSDTAIMSQSELSSTSVNPNIPIFAISYTQSTTPHGRNKFTPGQWENFLSITKRLHQDGIQQIRVWLDQCLWLRDAPQNSWAHTGILPYVLYPTICLGTRTADGDRTVSTYSRTWPFIEEVCALWSLGTITARQLREKGLNNHSVRQSIEYNHRSKLEPEQTLSLVFLNIFHGATDGLETGWVEDVIEMKDMALWNLRSSDSQINIGPNWRVNIAQCGQNTLPYMMMNKLLLQHVDPLYKRYNINFNGQNNADLYLDASRMLPNDRGWDGFGEWTSGNQEHLNTSPNNDAHNLFLLNNERSLYNVVTNVGEFQMMCHDRTNSQLWLLVAMDGRSSNITRGRVAWTKVIVGKLSCSLSEALSSGDRLVVSSVMEDQLKSRLTIYSITTGNVNNIQWV